MSMDDVKVHYNSDKPAQLQAHAYAQGSEIHLGAGQERHLPHEAWHIVQQAQGRVRPTLQMKAGALNDDPSMEKEADIMGEKAAQFAADHVARNLVAEERVAGVVTQRVVNIGTLSYAKPTAAVTKALIDRLDIKLTGALKDLKPGWKGALKKWVKDDSSIPHVFPDEDGLLAALEAQFPSKAAASSGKKRKAETEKQDQNMITLGAGIGDGERKRAKTLATHSSKAWKALVRDVSKRKSVTDTADELEGLNAGVMDTTSNVKSTASPFEFLTAMGSSGANDKLDRMDINFDGTEVFTHGFESPGNRAVAPRGSYKTKTGATKSFNPFNFNTVKIGNNIGTYAKHQSAKPVDLQSVPFTVLNTLEKFRLPEQAIGTSIKRDLMSKGPFTIQQGIGQNHLHTSVELLGATAGSGLSKQQLQHMRNQQELSNNHILNSAFATAPNQELGVDTGDGKTRTTPSAIHNQLDLVMGFDTDDKATKRVKKRELRRRVKRAMASTEGLANIESDDGVSDNDL